MIQTRRTLLRLATRTLPVAVCACWLAGDDQKPATATTYANGFDKIDVGPPPEELFVVNGNFEVAEVEGNRFLKLPGEPLQTFGLLFGPKGQVATEVAARIQGTNVGKTFPEFGVGANDTGGFRLWLLPGQDALEIRKEDVPKVRVPFKWQGGAWTHFRLRVSDAGGGKWRVQGKVWTAAAKEPGEWMIALDADAAPPAGQASVWGQPYAGTPIGFDDLAVTPVGK